MNAADERAEFDRDRPILRYLLLLTYCGESNLTSSQQQQHSICSSKVARQRNRLRDSSYGHLHVLAEQVAREEGVEGRSALVVPTLPAGRSAAQLGHAPDGAGAPRGGGGHPPGVGA